MSKGGRRNVDRKSSTERLPLACEATPDAISHFLLADLSTNTDFTHFWQHCYLTSAEALNSPYQPPAQSQLDPLIRNTALVQFYPHMRRILLSPIRRIAPKPSYIPSALFESHHILAKALPAAHALLEKVLKPDFCAHTAATSSWKATRTAIGISSRSFGFAGNAAACQFEDCVVINWIRACTN
ncbi:MAG: hypothetical protein L6R42_000701 [Xanthoria sp. 1 TBL-2021]|nr:MAG: hypothetical protein L6R42_000701 [Xanthoria sp. 1 TBL-2021]